MVHRFKKISILAEIVAEDAPFSQINAHGKVWEDSELWRVIYNPDTGFVDLLNYNSGTRSHIQVCDNGFIPETFKFFLRESGEHSDDSIWLRQHLEKIGI